MAASPETDVTVVILNRDGRSHLAASVPAALAMDGVRGPRSVLVADNGSTDGSVGFVERAFAGVRTLSFADNPGFAGGNNRAVDAVRTPYALLLNNDTAPRPDVLARLRHEAAASGAAFVGARLVTWDERRLDFDGGGAAFTGHGHPLGHGRAVTGAPGVPRDTLFCSGAAVLARTDAFRALGGFDETYCMYYEDVDLGWRAWLAGYGARHVPAAVVRHRGGGSAHLLTRADVGRRHEHNALATLVKNLGRQTLARVLPAALALAAVRAGADRGVIAAAVPPPGAWPPVPGPHWLGWVWLEPLELDWRRLWEARARVQLARRRPDGDVLPLLGRPLAPVPPGGAGWLALREAHRRFRLQELFGPLPRPSLRAAAAAVLEARPRPGRRPARGGPAGLAGRADRRAP